MLKEPITYADCEGNTITENFYFNLNKAELVMMEAGVKGGVITKLQNAMAEEDVPTIMGFFEDFIKRSYGVPDGKRFRKSAALTDEFFQSEAYSELFMKLFSDAEYADKFVRGVMPQDVVANIGKAEHPALNQ